MKLKVCGADFPHSIPSVSPTFPSMPAGHVVVGYGETRPSGAMHSGPVSASSSGGSVFG